jgi:hypothetical protein
MTVSWQLGAGKFCQYASGVVLMMILMLIAGVGCLLAGLLAIGFGIPVKEFSFGNTLIVTGVVGACAGLIILSMSAVVRELKNIAGRLGSGLPSNLPETAISAAAAEASGFSLSQVQSTGAHSDGAGAGLQSTAPSSAPWLDAATARERARSEAPAASEPVEAPPSPKPRRNLMFSSTSRKERERAQARAAEQPAADPRAAPATAQVSEPGQTPPATLEGAWPKSERSSSADATSQRRGGRTPSTFGEASAGAPGNDRTQPAGNEAQPAVTVLKSGVVDGMAYSLYSDGSIEAQMPEGMMRFASIDELRAHLDQRS